MTTTNNIPNVGTSATFSIGSDSYGGVLVYVSRTGGYVVWASSETSERKERKVRFTRCQDGEYRSGRYRHLTIGRAITYRDPSF